MTDPATPQRLALEKRLQELERKVAQLQRTPILTAASVTGLLRVKDASGGTVAALGNLGTEADPEYGFTVEGATDFILAATDERGLMRPWMPYGWRNPSDVKNVTTTAPFAVQWAATVQLITGLDFKLQVPVLVPAGTTAEVQVSTTFGALPWVLTPTADGAAHLYELNGPHGVDLLTGPILFQVEARRTSGAGFIGVYEPYTLAIGHNGGTPGWVTLT